MQTIELQSVTELKQENAHLKERLAQEEASARIRLANLEITQAKLDELMLEYCPDEMTAEQLSRYEESIKAV